MEATAKAGLARTLDRATTVVAVLMSIYHLVACNINLFQAGQHINLHILFALVIVFLQAIKIKEGRPTWQGWCMIGLLAASIAVCVYIHFNYTNFMTALGAQPFDKVFSGVCILLIVLIATQRTWGWVIPVISVIALLYGYFGPYLPGPLFHGGLSFSRLITYVTTNFDGIYGMLASVSANTIILFTIFGGMMDAFGAIGAIMNVAMSASTKIRSGGAQVAVLSSGLIGSITGSVAANITLTGAVSIPLMKKRGYPAEFAAACEAAASTGGAILPPVMNAAAFIIASWTGIPYITLVFVGITPALLYYGGIALSVYIKACKLGDEKVRDETLTAFHSAFLNLLVFIIPVILLVVLMVMGESAQKSLFLAICCLALVGLIQQFVMREEKPLHAFVKKLLAGFENGGRTVASIAVVMACMGVVVQMMTATGLSSKISQFALAIAGDNLLILVLLGVLLFIIALPVKKEDPAATDTGTDITEQYNAGILTSSGQQNVAQQDTVYVGTQAVTAGSMEEYAAYLEEKLKKMLESVRGVGEVEVMITLESSEERIVEKDMTAERSQTEEQDSAGGTRTVSSSNTGYQTVYQEGSQGSPFVVKTITPKVEGVLVVAEGAGKGNMTGEITQVVQALFGVEAHKVKVLEK